MKFIGIRILNPLKTSGGQPIAFLGFGIWLEGCFLSWILIVDPWVLTPEMQVAAASGIWTVRKPQTTQSHKLVHFKQTWTGSLMVNGRKVSHAPRVCAFGGGKTSSRTLLISMIIFVFGEFGASAFAINIYVCTTYLSLNVNGLLFPSFQMRRFFFGTQGFG